MLSSKVDKDIEKLVGHIVLYDNEMECDTKLKTQTITGAVRFMYVLVYTQSLLIKYI